MAAWLLSQCDGTADVIGSEPKQQRSRATRQRLLESTVHLLATLGWQAATTTAIAEHAKVSRGSLQHHFPTREELVVAALEYVFEQRTAELVAATEQAPGERDARVGFVSNLLIDLYSGELFKASLHVWTAAASDAELKARIIPLEDRFSREAFRIAMDLLHADYRDAKTFRKVQITLDLARGLGLADVLSDDTERRNKIAAAWAHELSDITVRE